MYGKTKDTLHKMVASNHKKTPGFINILGVLSLFTISSLFFSSLFSLTFISFAINIKYGTGMKLFFET